MFTRAKRAIIPFLVLSYIAFRLIVHESTEYEDMEWFETHTAAEDVTFQTGADNYAYTTFYDPAAAQVEEAEWTAARVAAGEDDHESGYNVSPEEVATRLTEDDYVMRVYLPVEDARIAFQHLSEIRIGDVTYHSGDTLTGITSGETTNVMFVGADGAIVDEREVKFYVASGTASLYIQVQSGDIREIAIDKEQKGTITYETVNADGSVDCGGEGEIHARGNNNKSYDKKSYSINLGSAAPLLGMETASKWALRATPDDYTMLMDRLVLDTARAIDVPYSVDAEHVNLYINGEYEGVYLMTQRVKVDDGAVDMDDGYLMEFESTGRYEAAEQGFKTLRRNIVVHSPEDLDETELQTLAGYVQEAEDAVYSGTGINSATGKTWFEYLDAASWIKQFWIQEFFINYDADYTSTYMTKEEDDPLLYAGPCWDFDKTFWHTYYNNAYQSNILTLRGRKMESWMKQLMNTQDFYAAATQYYLNAFSQTVAQVEQEIPALVSKIGPSLLMMYDRYGDGEHDQEYLDRIEGMFTDWYGARLLFYEDYLTNQDSYVRLYFNLPRDVKHMAVFAVKKGEPVSFVGEVEGCSQWSYDGGRILEDGAVFTYDTQFEPLESGEGNGVEDSE